MLPLQFYSRKDIQDELLRISKNRDVAVRFNESLGRRPDIIQFKGDIIELIKKGATSFHISEERWKYPLNLKAGMSKHELDELRSGWDLILDVDSDELKYSKVTAKLLVNALQFHGIKNLSVKFSGSTGFHIAVPFEAFPDKIDGKEARLSFPEYSRIIASYLKSMIEKHLEKELGKDPFSKVDIDTVLISSRHMFRSPYSFHEKTGLVSIPIDPNKVNEFNSNDAKPENVKTDIKFLDVAKISDAEAKKLVMQALDFVKKIEPQELKQFTVPNVALKDDLFPPCIKAGLTGLSDGRKRFLFLLINFLKSAGWNIDGVENKISEWNSKNKEPLKEGYIKSQINWVKRQGKVLTPPNCNNPGYYIDIGICKPDNLCKLIKNPINYSTRKNNISKKSLKSYKHSKYQ